MTHATAEESLNGLSSIMKAIDAGTAEISERRIPWRGRVLPTVTIQTPDPHARARLVATIRRSDDADPHTDADAAARITACAVEAVRSAMEDATPLLAADGHSRLEFPTDLAAAWRGWAVISLSDLEERLQAAWRDDWIEIVGTTPLSDGSVRLLSGSVVRPGSAITIRDGDEEAGAVEGALEISVHHLPSDCLEILLEPHAHVQRIAPVDAVDLLRGMIDLARWTAG